MIISNIEERLTPVSAYMTMHLRGPKSGKNSRCVRYRCQPSRNRETLARYCTDLTRCARRKVHPWHVPGFSLSRTHFRTESFASVLFLPAYSSFQSPWPMQPIVPAWLSRSIRWDIRWTAPRSPWSTPRCLLEPSPHPFNFIAPATALWSSTAS